MYYLAFLFICSLNPDFNDTHWGNLCIRFIDQPEQHYATKAQCEERILVMLHQVTADSSGLHFYLPGPWEWHYDCYVPPDKETDYG